MGIKRNLLWIDCFGGLAAGALFLLAADFFVNLHRLPFELILVIGIANVVYGSFSLSLALRKTRPLVLIKLLAIANMVWLPIIFSFGFWQINSASIWGLAHLFGEGIYVGALGFIEWQNKEDLLTI